MTAAFNFKDPDYLPITQGRWQALQRIRKVPGAVADLKAYYRENVADFINDFGVTYDPRNLDIGRSAIVPFVLFPRQREFVDWVVAHWHGRSPGLTEKSRDGGISWLCIAIGCSLCILFDGMRVGYGSRKEEYVDKIDEPKSLFWKARFFMRYLPEEFRSGWREGVNSPFMRMTFPETGSSLTGESGDGIGRGDRTSVYFVDEAAHIARPRLVDAALSLTTNCRIDVSSVNGMNNSFAQRRHSGKIDVFIWDWRDDPRKDDEWYAKQEADLDPIVVAQEIDRDYQAAVEGVVIPGKWIQAAIGARRKLGLGASGAKTAAYDVADGGTDKHAVVAGQGIEVSYAKEWASSKEDGDDIFHSVEQVFEICDELEIDNFRYDADGLGAGVRGDARVINARRARMGLRALAVDPYRGSDSVLDPEMEDVKGRKNLDFFGNRKAQAWWRVRSRFQKTFRWVTDGVAADPNEIISLDEDCPNLQKLVGELGQPQYRTNDIGKILIQKKPDGMKSPNLADALVMKFSGPARRALVIPKGLAKKVAVMQGRRRRTYD